MTDEELADAAAKVMELDDRISKLESRRATLKQDIRVEMERRGTRGLITNGMKLTYVAPVVVQYDEVRLRRALGAELWEEATTVVLDKAKLLGLVQEGKVPLRKVERYASEVPRAPYVLVNVDRD